MTFRLLFIVTVQILVVNEAQAPSHPRNVEFASGVAVRVTTCPCTKPFWQVPWLLWQLMPEGTLVTVPVPLVSEGRMLRVKVC